MRIITWNVNGLRSVHRNGFTAWAEQSGADIICVQEIKAEETHAVALPVPKGYFLYLNSAERKGYSGTACYVKERPQAVTIRLGQARFDSEGRMIELEYPNFTLLNFYITNGARDQRDMAFKLAMYQRIFDYLRSKKTKPLILAGDFNIAHTPLDLARPKENQRNTMFTPAERIQIDHLLNFGFLDTFRTLHPSQSGAYTWWPYFANARPRNLGWRIDYVFASTDLRPKLRSAFILEGVLGSDHCPLGADFDL